MKTAPEIIEYNKLVGDKIPKKIRKNGGKCKIRVLSPEGLKIALPAKLTEEVNELKVASTKESRLLEAADVIQVTTDLLWISDLSLYDFRTQRRAFQLTIPQTFGKLTEKLLQLACDLEESSQEPENILNTLVAVVEITIAIARLDNWDKGHLDSEVEKRLQTRGSFRKGYFLVWATAP